MDPRFGIAPEDLYNLQMEVKQVQYTQSNHAERIMRLEKRQADDAALKSVWNSPFPGVLSGTPQHGMANPLNGSPPASNLPSGPVPQNDVFDDLDEQGEQLLGSLHLGPTEEEPPRRGAASRANSVRFDESALHGSNWAGHNSRHSGDFAPTRPSSGLMMERSLSHKSDGRHSSTGQSVHSHHSVASGRASSLGLDTNFAVGDEDDSDLDIPGPPASFYILGTVPSIVRCWLTTNYAHATLLYADICTGSQKSTVDYSLIKELDLSDEMQRDMDGAYRVRLNVYFAEAVVIQHSSRSSSPERSVPSMTVCFEVTGADGPTTPGENMGIRIYIGSDALRAHSADVLFSRNTMVLHSNDRSRIRVPFVRPEDDAAFKHITTSSVVPEKPKLNANAAPFVLGEVNAGVDDSPDAQPKATEDNEEGRQSGPVSPTAMSHEPHSAAGPASVSDNGGDSDKSSKPRKESESGRDGSVTSDASRQGSSGAGIWGSWRHGADGQRETGSLSGYQPAARGGRNMKILKPQKSASSSARTGASYELPPLPKSGGEGRRKSQASVGGDQGPHGGNRWDTKRAVSSAEAKSSGQHTSRDSRNAQALPRTSNPVGGASAFSWMTPPGKPKTSTAAQ